MTKLSTTKSRRCSIDESDSYVYHYYLIILRMIIHSTLEQPFCRRVCFSHSTNVITNTKEVQKFSNTFRNGLKMKKCMSAPRLARSNNNYNNYFINPELRYKKRTVDPKTVKKNLVNDQYLYNTLHDDDDFNNWKHPFARPHTTQQERKHKISEEDVQRLLVFKKHIESKKKGRVPALVNQIIRQNS